jgi:hypothetical protein
LLAAVADFGLKCLIIFSHSHFFIINFSFDYDDLNLVNNLRSYLEEIIAAPGLENRSYDRRDSLR